MPRENASMGTAGTKELCGRAQRGLEAAPGRGGRQQGRSSFRRLGFGAHGRAGVARRPASFFPVGGPWRARLEPGAEGLGRAAGAGGGLREGRCRLAGRLRLRGDDLVRSSSGGLLRQKAMKRPPMGSGSRVTPWDSRRGQALDCAQGTTPAGHLARRRAGGGRGASWRMRVAAVTCCEADDRVVHSAALRVATPRPLDATLACHRRPTTTRRRPTTVSTGARRRHNGASVSRTLTEAFRNSGASTFHDVVKRTQTTPPPP